MGTIPAIMGDPCLTHMANSSPVMAFPAVPFVLQFEAKDGEQTIMKGGDDKNGFEVKVKRLDEDN